MVDNFSPAILVGCGGIEDEGHEDVAMGVDVTPHSLKTGRSKSLGELESLLEIEGNDEFAVKVDVAKLTVFFDELVKAMVFPVVMYGYES